MRRKVSLRTVLIVALGFGVTISALLAALLMSSSSLDVRFIGRQGAFAEMDLVRAQFPGQVPCVDRAGAKTHAASAGASLEPRTVHMLAWEREDDRLVHASTPYWALHIAGFKLNAARMIAPPLEHVTLVDLERCGRGLIVDRPTAGGGRIVIWAE